MEPFPHPTSLLMSTHSDEESGSLSEPQSSATSSSSDCPITLAVHHERWYTLGLGDTENDNKRCRALVDSPGLIVNLLPDHVVGFDVLKAVERVDSNSLPLFGRSQQRWRKNAQGFESFMRNSKALITPLLDQQSRVSRRRWKRLTGDKQRGFDLISRPGEESAVLRGPVHAAIRIAEELNQAEAQIAVFAKELFISQRNRRFVLGVALAEGKLSFLLADRAGIVVSEVYDTRHRIDIFLRVCMGLLFVDIYRLGYDPAFTQEGNVTFVLIAGERYKIKRGIVKDNDLEGSGLRITLLEKDGKEYVMKDVWIHRARHTKEFDIFRLITDLNIEGTARIVSHEAVHVDGEVDSTERARQAWLDEYCQAFSSESRLVKDHHRIVMTPYGAPLQRFRSLEELVSALKDVVLTIQELDKHKLLHRDISTENIILVDQGAEIRKGMLIDFEYATYYDIHEAPKRGKCAVGSVSFMSHRVLEYFEPKYYDELESVLYVLCWICTSLSGPNDGTRYFNVEQMNACNGAIGAYMRRDEDYEDLGCRKHMFIKSSDTFKAVLKDFHPFFNSLRSLAEDIRGVLMDTGNMIDVVRREPEVDPVIALRDHIFAAILKGFDTCLDEIRSAKPNVRATLTPSRPVLASIPEHANGNMQHRIRDREKQKVGCKGCTKDPSDENKENRMPVPIIS